MWHDEFYFDMKRFAKGVTVCFDGGGGSSKSTSTSYTPAMEQWQKKALNIYGPTLGQGTRIPSGEIGERLAPLTPAQTQAADVQGFLDRFAPYRDMPMFGETGTALSGILSGEMGAAPFTPEATERYIKGAIVDPRRREFEKYEAPGIREEYAGPGYWGSARPRAISEARGEMEDWIGEMSTQTRWDVEQANRAIEEAKAGRALAGIQPAMEYGQLPTREAMARIAGRGDVAALSGIQQQQQQAEMNMARQILSEEFAITDPEDLQILMTLLSTPYSKTVSETQEGGFLSKLGGGLAMGVGMGLGGSIMTPFVGGGQSITALENPWAYGP